MISTLRRLGGAGSDTSPELLPLEDGNREDPGNQIIGQEVALVEPIDPQPETVLVGRESGKGKGSAGGTAAPVRRSPGGSGERRGVPPNSEALVVTPVRGRRPGEDRGDLGTEAERGAQTSDSGYQSAELRMPIGPPITFGPMGSEEAFHNPLFNQEQLLRLRELQRQAAWIYQRPSGEFIPPVSRPEFLEQEERRIERDKEVEEMRKEIHKLHDENLKVKKKLQEQQDMASRLIAEREAMKYGTPEEESELEMRLRMSREEDLKNEIDKRGEVNKEKEEDKKEVRSEKKEEATQIQIMVKLMEGMQALQNRILDGKDEDRSNEAEIVQNQPHPLPELCEWDPSTGPIDLGDWLSLIEPIMSDLSKSSATWWSKLMLEASSWYEDHQQLPPLSRLSHDPIPSSSLRDPRWSRLEKRAATMLLRALPQQARDEMVSSKRLSAFAIVCQLLKSYQPGGLGEKELVLKSLETPVEASTIGEAVTGLRKWTRWRRRASELQITEPDPFLLLKGLNRLIRKPLESHRDLAFRINLARSTLQVDATPTSKSVTSFASHLLAECEQVAHQEMTPKKPKEKNEDRSKTMRLKRIEEEGKAGGKGKDAGKENWEPRERFPCKFFNGDGGCKKGKECRYLHELKDEKRRCYNCGSVDHISPNCNRPRGGDVNASRNKAAKIEGEEVQGNASRDATSPPEEGEQGAVMKNLLEEANKMLKSLTSEPSGSGVGGTTGSLSRATTSRGGDANREEVMDRLQKQLDELRQKTLRISRMATSEKRGLLDSGATHALRPMRTGEDGKDLVNVRVTLADGGLVDLKMNPMGTMVINRQDVEPIVPMGAMIRELGCRVLWEGDQVKVEHPSRGSLPVSCEEGCPLIPRSLALDLIQELEDLKKGVELRRVSFEGEMKWMRELVDSHPVLRSLPEVVKKKLVVTPGDWRTLPGNRRLRKKWRREGLVAHWYAGKDEGFTLSRALQQQGGDAEMMVEVDILRSAGQDLLEDEGIYAGFIRVALDGKLRGLIGGPNCRTRSVLRHYEVDGDPQAPRPIRKWDGEEFGVKDASPEERRIIEEDDVLLWRMVFLYLVAEYLRRARGEKREVKFTVEQPASPRSYKPEVVSWWDTEEWKKLQAEFDFKEYTYTTKEIMVD